MERNTNPLYILRFIAAIMVVWLHFGPNRNFFTTNGGEAVTFFFFLSGFVMIIANSKYLTGKNLNFSKTDFYIKRFARIYPMYYLKRWAYKDGFTRVLLIFPPGRYPASSFFIFYSRQLSYILKAIKQNLKLLPGFTLF